MKGFRQPKFPKWWNDLDKYVLTAVDFIDDKHLRAAIQVKIMSRMVVVGSIVQEKMRTLLQPNN